MKNHKSNKTLILGINGMLGSMVYSFFRNNNHRVLGTHFGGNPDKSDKNDSIHFDAGQNVGGQLVSIFKDFCPDYIINCIGIIKPWCRDDDQQGVKNAINVNALFPHILADTSEAYNPNIKIITIATDCVFSGVKGGYVETDPHDPLDVYGKTKSLGEVMKANFLNIRCSIIGPEITGKKSLLEWFLSNPDGSTVRGFTHHLWNGVTTLQFAELCNLIITEERFTKLRNLNHVIHWVENETVSKYQLLHIFNEVFDRDIRIVSDNNTGAPVLRTLSSELTPVENMSMKKAIYSLKEYIKQYKTQYTDE